jgi:hypothetical protein
MAAAPSGDAAAENPFGDPITRAFLHDVETSTRFWDATPQLQYIAHVAAEQRVSPWGLLALVQVHRLSHVPPSVVLVDRAGKKGTRLEDGTSLNFFVSLVARTGGGKSVTFRLASGVLPPNGTPVPDGTGQGIVRHIAETRIVRKDEENKPLQVPYRVTLFHRHSLTIHAPEIKTLAAEFAREGSKTDAMMRSMWVGEVVGMTVADMERRVVIPANMARIAGAWGVQPVNAVALLAQADDGTPQRFLWAPAAEYRRPYPSRTPVPQGVTFPMPVFNSGSPFGVSDMPSELRDDDPLPDPIWVEWSPQMTTDIAAVHAAEDALYDCDPYADRSFEQQDAEKALTMQSHMTLTRIKLAALMGFIHGRANPSDLDWQLSGVQLDVSTAELSGVWKRCEQARLTVAQEKGAERAVELYSADTTRTLLKNSDTDQVAADVWAMLALRPRKAKEIRDRLSSRKRLLLKDALASLETEDRAEYDTGEALWWALWKGKRIRAEEAGDAKGGTA